MTPPTTSATTPMKSYDDECATESSTEPAEQVAVTTESSPVGEVDVGVGVDEEALNLNDLTSGAIKGAIEPASPPVVEDNEEEEKEKEEELYPDHRASCPIETMQKRCVDEAVAVAATDEEASSSVKATSAEDDAGDDDGLDDYDHDEGGLDDNEGRIADDEGPIAEDHDGEGAIDCKVDKEDCATAIHSSSHSGGGAGDGNANDESREEEGHGESAIDVCPDGQTLSKPFPTPPPPQIEAGKWCLSPPGGAKRGGRYRGDPRRGLRSWLRPVFPARGELPRVRRA